MIADAWLAFAAAVLVNLLWLVLLWVIIRWGIMRLAMSAPLRWKMAGRDAA